MRALERLESGLLISLFAAMVGVAVWQIAARNLFGGGLMWGDGFVRVAVLWLTLVGAMVASRGDDHVRIDVVTRLLPARWHGVARRLAAAFTALVMLTFCFYSAHFAYLDYVYGIVAFGEVPAWVCELVMPLAGAVIGLRYALLTFRPA